MSNYLFDGLLGGAVRDKRFAELINNRSYTYGDVLDVTGRFANVLVGLGVQPGDRVAVQVNKSIEAVMLYPATVRAGGAFLPLNTAYTASEIEYFLDNAKPRVFVCDPSKYGDYESICEARGIRLEALGVYGTDENIGSLAEAGSSAPVEFETVVRGADDLAAILYTSGTTGRSKGAMLTHENLLSNAKVLADYWRFTSDDVLLHILPIFHTHGLFVAINTVLLARASMYFRHGFSVDDVIENLPHCTTMMGVPTHYTRLLDDDRFNQELTSHMRLFTSGSAPLLAETHKHFEARTGHRILERYGMTETNMNTSNPYEGERRAGTVGFPLPGTEVVINNAETGEQVPNGETGAIEVRGPNVFKGYWEMPDKTREELRDNGFFITGDLGKIDEDGYVHIVGRAKDLIISGGFNVYPKEIESVLDDIDGVSESAVIGIPHSDFGEAVVGVLVAERNAELDENSILESLKTKIARFKQPKKIFVIDELPRNTMGKVQKNVLRDRYQDLFT
ncbi:MAG: malonyl-CoA synthase [Pseudomonadota bacterium]